MHSLYEPSMLGVGVSLFLNILVLTKNAFRMGITALTMTSDQLATTDLEIIPFLRGTRVHSPTHPLQITQVPSMVLSDPCPQEPTQSPIMNFWTKTAHGGSMRAGGILTLQAAHVVSRGKSAIPVHHGGSLMPSMSLSALYQGERNCTQDQIVAAQVSSGVSL